MPDVYINPKDLSRKADEPKKEIKNLKHKSHRIHNPLSSYCYMPEGIDFINKEPNEKVILLTRRHIITNFGWGLLVVLMLFAPIVLNYFPLLNFLPLKFQTLAILFWYLLTLAIFIQGFLSWFFSVNIVTNKRVIDVDFDNLIYRKVTDAEISKIEDATVSMGSVLRTLFDFGDVLIQTAAEIPEIEFWAVPHPDQIDKLLSDIRLKTKP